MIDILEIFNGVISQHRSIDMAESEFKKMLYEDDEIHHAYKEWCKEMGYTEKKGFVEYCNEYFDEEDSKWDILENEYE